MKKIDFAVKKIKKEWRTVDKRNERKFTIRAKIGDEISWSVRGSDASFQFSDSPLFIEGNDTVPVKNGKILTRTVAPNAEPKTYEYAVFIHKDEVFARGESPPKIIIWD